MIPLALFLIAPLTPAKVIDFAIAAHTTQHRGRVRIERRLAKAVAKVELVWRRPDRVLMRYRETGVDQTVFLAGNRVTAYDANTLEFIQRKVPDGPLVQRMTKAVGPFEYAAQVLLEPAAMRAFLSPYRSKAIVRSSTKNVLLTQGKVTFLFDARTHRLVKATNGGQSWSISYLAPTAVAFRPPSSALLVDVFSPPSPMPQFASKDAEAIVRKIVRAYRGYRLGIVSVTSEGGTTRIAFSGPRFKQTNPSARWAYDGHTLRYNAGGSIQSQKTRRSDLLDVLAQRQLPVDPVLRSLIARQTPFQEFFGTEAKASLGGKVGINGTPCMIVNLKRPDSRSALFVRPDGFVLSVSTDILSLRGDVLDTSIRRFVYAPLSPGESFTIR